MAIKYHLSPEPTGDPETYNSNYIRVVGNRLIESHYDTACAGSSRSKVIGEKIYFCIPYKYFPKDVDKVALEKAFKSWIIFGRKLGFYVEYHGEGDVISVSKKCAPNLNYRSDAIEKISGLVISWETGELLYDGHSLEILSFFRYFYSYQSNSIYYRSVELKNKYPEMPEKTCFWAAHILSKLEKKYDSYYGFFISNPAMKRGLLLIPNLAKLNERRIYSNNNKDEDDNNGEVNLIWSNYYGGKNIDCTKEEYIKYSNIDGMSDSLFRAIKESGESAVEIVKDVMGKEIRCPEFVDELVKNYNESTLDKYLEKFLNLHEQN